MSTTNCFTTNDRENGCKKTEQNMKISGKFREMKWKSQSLKAIVLTLGVKIFQWNDVERDENYVVACFKNLLTQMKNMLKV